LVGKTLAAQDGRTGTVKECCREVPLMATVHQFPRKEPEPDGVFDRLARLLRLEVELGIAEARQLLVSAAIAVALAVTAAIVLLASIVVLLAGALAPLFGAAWEHLVIAGGGMLLLSLAVIGWSAWRLKNLRWPTETLASLRETWHWLGLQLRSRLTSR
jgi:hypothetical protein